jgi:hypothetical protein
MEVVLHEELLFELTIVYTRCDCGIVIIENYVVGFGAV